MNIVTPSQLDKNNPGTWPLIYKILLWALLLGVLFFLYNRFVRTPIIEQQETNQAKITELENQYKELYQYQLDLPKYQQRAKELVGILQGLLVYLPSQAEMPDLIDDVYASAVNNDITFATFTPQSDQEEEYYNIKPINLETTTGYTNFAQFVEAISGLDRILNISNMAMTVNSETADLLEIDSQLQTYIYTPDIQKFLDDAGVEESSNEK